MPPAYADGFLMKVHEYCLLTEKLEISVACFDDFAFVKIIKCNHVRQIVIAIPSCVEYGYSACWEFERNVLTPLLSDYNEGYSGFGVYIRLTLFENIRESASFCVFSLSVGNKSIDILGLQHISAEVVVHDDDIRRCSGVVFVFGGCAYDYCDCGASC